jgi:hypothetical protein
LSTRVVDAPATDCVRRPSGFEYEAMRGSVSREEDARREIRNGVARDHEEVSVDLGGLERDILAPLARFDRGALAPAARIGHYDDVAGDEGDPLHGAADSGSSRAHRRGSRRGCIRDRYTTDEEEWGDERRYGSDKNFA